MRFIYFGFLVNLALHTEHFLNISLVVVVVVLTAGVLTWIILRP